MRVTKDGRDVEVEMLFIKKKTAAFYHLQQI